MIPKSVYNETKSSDTPIELELPFPMLQPRGLIREEYTKLTDKIYTTFIDIHERYNDYDWYLKADHDTFVFVDNLRQYVANKNNDIPIVYGYNLKTWLSGKWIYLAFSC